MRHEISEPKNWRSRSAADASKDSCWAGRRRANSTAPLPADAVDAAFASGPAEVEAVRGSRRDLWTTAETEDDKATVDCPDLISSLSAQMALLEAQHEQLSRLLEQAKTTDG